MRIALLTRRFDPAGGGTERDLMITIDCLRQRGHEISVYADDVRATVPGLNLHRVGCIRLPRTLAFLRFAFAAAPRARRDGTDLVLSFARVANADVLRSGGSAHLTYLRAARRWMGAARAAAMRAAPYHRAQVIVERRGFTNPDLRAAIAVSELVRQDLIAQFQLNPEKVKTLYNGVDLERFRPAADPALRNQIRRRFQIALDAPLVLFVGNGFARKGLAFLIDAIAVMKDSKPRLLVVGSDRALGSFRRRARQRGIESRVTFAGSQSSVERFFHAADAFALPSLFEPFGNVAMEAMACGVPALVSSQCGAAELMPAELRPFVLDDPADAAEIANKLERLLKASLGLKGIPRAAAEQYTWERHAHQLNRLIDTLTDKVPNPSG